MLAEVSYDIIQVLYNMSWISYDIIRGTLSGGDDDNTYDNTRVMNKTGAHASTGRSDNTNSYTSADTRVVNNNADVCDGIDDDTDRTNSYINTRSDESDTNTYANTSIMNSANTYVSTDKTADTIDSYTSARSTAVM